MLKRLNILTLTCVLASASALLAGCGQKGPLYLPISEPTQDKTVAPVETPAEKSKKPDQKALTE